MKHKNPSISISKILECFRGTSNEKVAIHYNQSSKQVLNLSNFEELLLSINESTCPNTFAIQKYIKPDSEITAVIRLPDENIEILENTTHDIIQEVIQQTTRVLQFLSFNAKSLAFKRFHWVVSDKILFLCSIENAVVDPVIPVSGYFYQVSSRSCNKRSRPMTAHSDHKKSIRRDSLSFARLITKKTVDNFAQTDNTKPCNCLRNLEITSQEILKTLSEIANLESLIKSTKENAKAEQINSEAKWKAKCLDISKVISDQIYEENKKYLEKIKNIKNSS